MPVQHRIFLDLDLVYTQVFGEVDLAEVLRALHRLRADPHYRLGLCDLVNLDGLTRANAKSRDIAGLVTAVNGQEMQRTQTSILAPCDYSFGMARQYQTFASMQDGFQVSIHRSEPDAMAVLDLTEPTIEALLALQRHVLVEPDPMDCPAQTSSQARLTSSRPARFSGLPQ